MLARRPPLWTPSVTSRSGGGALPAVAASCQVPRAVRAPGGDSKAPDSASDQPRQTASGSPSQAQPRSQSTASLPWGGSSGKSSKGPIIQHIAPSKQSSKAKNTGAPGTATLPVNPWQVAAKQQQQQHERASPPSSKRQQQRKLESPQSTGVAPAATDQQRLPTAAAAEATLPSPVAAADADAAAAIPILPLSVGTPHSSPTIQAAATPLGVVQSTRKRRAQRLRPPVSPPSATAVATSMEAQAAETTASCQAAAAGAASAAATAAGGGGGGGAAAAATADPNDTLQLDDVFELGWSSDGPVHQSSFDSDPWQQPQQQQQQLFFPAIPGYDATADFGSQPLTLCNAQGAADLPLLLGHHNQQQQQEQSPPPQQQQQQEQQQLRGPGGGRRRSGQRRGVAGAAYAAAFLQGLGSSPLPALQQATPLWQQQQQQPSGPGQQHQEQQAEPGKCTSIKPKRRGAQYASQHPSLTSRTWAEVAGKLLPSLYDASWHTSLAAFCIDLWNQVTAAHEEGNEEQLEACYAFAQACIRQSSGSSSSSSNSGSSSGGSSSGGRGSTSGGSSYAQGSCLLPLAEMVAGPDSEALTAGCIDHLGPEAVSALLLPAVRIIAGPAAERQAAAAAAASGGFESDMGGGGGSMGEGAEAAGRWGELAAPGLWEGLRRVMELRDVYPGMELSTLAHLAQQHGAWSD